LRWFWELPQQAAWRPDSIVVPFAGSGTLLFESWLYLAQIPPYLWRAENFISPLPAVPPSTLASIRKRLSERQKTDLLPAILIEKDAGLAEALNGHLQKFQGPLRELEAKTEIHAQDLFLIPAPAHGRLFLPLNPPYGLRLSHEDQQRPAEFYAKLALLLLSWRQGAEELRGFILVPDEFSLNALYRELGGSRILAVHSFTQGGQHIRCLAFQI
jgi:23S rRNA G2445 N2-methylase RlmL